MRKECENKSTEDSIDLLKEKKGIGLDGIGWTYFEGNFQSGNIEQQGNGKQNAF